MSVIGDCNVRHGGMIIYTNVSFERKQKKKLLNNGIYSHMIRGFVYLFTNQMLFPSFSKYYSFIKYTVIHKTFQL